MKYSVIVPVYNRPDEVDELLESLCSQTLKDFEVVIVEDGSEKTCKDVCDKYASILDLHYYYKDNSGPGQSRNYGVEHANGDYVIILDSDVVLPENYMMAINSQLPTLNFQLDMVSARSRSMLKMASCSTARRCSSTVPAYTTTTVCWVPMLSTMSKSARCGR